MLRSTLVAAGRTATALSSSAAAAAARTTPSAGSLAVAVSAVARGACARALATSSAVTSRVASGVGAVGGRVALPHHGVSWRAGVARAVRARFDMSRVARVVVFGVQRGMSTSAKAAPEAAAAAAAVRASANKRLVGFWLATISGMVFVMVVLGGVTRLTRSGLSIVEWRPTGETLPTTDEAWQVEFDKYKLSPEFQRVNRHMTLDEFKPIYWMEWFHRFWGRAIGVAFALPLGYFMLASRIPAGTWPRLATLLALGAAQGGVGWWMVKSGLEHERFDEHAIPRVSPYRLATHLGFAFALYSALVWTSMDLLAAPIRATAEQVARTARLRPTAYTVTGLIALTAASGAFVAGNDAGHAYNDWPMMAGRFVPEQVWMEEMGARNFTENSATVQFDHRMLAYTSICGVGAVHLAAKRLGGIRTFPLPVYRSMIGLGILISAQVALGISTLMLYVPVSLGAAHQGGALALLTGAIALIHRIHATSRATIVDKADVVLGAKATTAMNIFRKVGMLGTAAGLGALVYKQRSDADTDL